MRALEEKTGVKNPRLRSRPRPRTDSRIYREAYGTLSNSRSFNQVGLQPIRIVDVLAYIEIAGVRKGYPAQKLLRHIQAMDAAHLEWWGKKNNKKG